METLRRCVIWIRGRMVKSLYQLSQGFVGAEGWQVKVLPEDVEGGAPFGLQLINLTQLSSSPSAPLMLSEEGERQGLVASCICACLHTKSESLEEDGKTQDDTLRILKDCTVLK